MIKNNWFLLSLFFIGASFYFSTNLFAEDKPEPAVIKALNVLPEGKWCSRPRDFFGHTVVTVVYRAEDQVVPDISQPINIDVSKTPLWISESGAISFDVKYDPFWERIYYDMSFDLSYKVFGTEDRFPVKFLAALNILDMGAFGGGVHSVEREKGGEKPNYFNLAYSDTKNANYVNADPHGSERWARYHKLTDTEMDFASYFVASAYNTPSDIILYFRLEKCQ